MMLQGFKKQLRGVVGKTVPGIPVTAGSQLIPPVVGSEPEKVSVPTAILPPAVPLLASIMAPVGIVDKPKEFSRARNDSQFIVSYIRLKPPRNTVRPLPMASQAKPTRGAKSLWSPL